MPEIQYHFPVKTPEGFQLTPKSQKRYDSGFSPSLTIDEALQYMREECEKLPDAEVKIYTNYEHVAVTRLRKRVADDSSVCVEIKMDGREYYMISSQWGLTEQNIYALHLAIRAVHNIVKWGVADYRSIMRGFKASGAKMSENTAHTVDEEELINRGQWLAILRLDENATLEDANSAYRHYAKLSASSEEGLLRLNQAIEEARAYFARHADD